MRMDFDAFGEIVKAYDKEKERESRDAWERMRMLATYTLQPHVKKGQRITPQKLLPFAWDHENDNKPKIKMTPEEQRARMKALAESQGVEMI